MRSENSNKSHNGREILKFVVELEKLFIFMRRHQENYPTFSHLKNLNGFSERDLVSLFPCRRGHAECPGFEFITDDNTSEVYAIPCACLKVSTSLEPYFVLQLATMKIPQKDKLHLGGRKNFLAWQIFKSEEESFRWLWNFLVYFAFKNDNFLKNLTKLVPLTEIPANIRESRIFLEYFLLFQRLFFSSDLIYLQWEKWINLASSSGDIYNRYLTSCKNSELIVLDLGNTVFKMGISSYSNNSLLKHFETFIDNVYFGIGGLVVLSRQQFFKENTRFDINQLVPNYENGALGSFVDQKGRLRFESTKLKTQAFPPLAEVLRPATLDKLFELLARGQKKLDKFSIDN